MTECLNYGHQNIMRILGKESPGVDDRLKQDFL